MHAIRLLIWLAVAVMSYTLPPAHAAQPTTTELRELQQRLAVLGFDPGAVDGLLGPSTREAIRAFQRRQGLPVTGRVDDALNDRLEKALVRGIQSELKAQGADPGSIDGFWGDSTEQAYRRLIGSSPPNRPSAALLRRLRQTEREQPRPQIETEAGIRQLQANLTVLGFDTGGVDGMPGPSTLGAVRRFQRDQGLPVTGRITPGLHARVEQELIRFIQQRLKVLGFEPGNANGHSGALTQAAIRAFENQQGLPASGQPSAALAAHLETAFRAGQKQPTPFSEDQIRHLQRQLTRLGLQPGPVDSRLGPSTTAAIRRYQRSKGLPETGRMTVELLTRIDSEIEHAQAVDKAVKPLPMDRTALVTETQARLNSLGYNAGPADGAMGPRTAAAIQSFERQIGLPQTGQPSAVLLERLRNTPLDKAKAPPARGRRLANGNTEVRGRLQLQYTSTDELLGCSIEGVQLDLNWCVPFENRSDTDDCRAVIRPNTQVLMVKCS